MLAEVEAGLAHEAIEELRRCAGAQFDPEVVAAFIEVASPDRQLVPAG